MTPDLIQSPKDPNLARLCGLLREKSAELELQVAKSQGVGLSDEGQPANAGLENRPWPQSQLNDCAQFGVFRWFVPKEYGGAGWSPDDVIRGYLALAAACQTTTFVITQRVAACRRIVLSNNEEFKSRVLPLLAVGDLASTVGISHLTTSRRHIKQPVLRAKADGGGFIVDGFSPWVTGGFAADYVVMGATIMDDDDNATSNQLLFAVDPNAPGVKVAPGHALVALSGSQTGAVTCEQVRIEASHLLAGPVESVLSAGVGTGSGGLQTSTLAIGLAAEAIDFIGSQANRRPELTETHAALSEQLDEARNRLLSLAAGRKVCDRETLRTEANSLVLRSTQSALVAAKGAGFVAGHPVGRWCREAMFFLVWSCPQSVVEANLCELAGIEG